MTRIKEAELERRLDSLEASIEDRFISIERTSELLHDLIQRGAITTVAEAMDVAAKPWRYGDVFESVRALEAKQAEMKATADRALADRRAAKPPREAS